MSIALYDADFVSSHHSPYNIQLMKASSYYKKKKQIVVFLTDITKYYLYEKVYYFQNDLSVSIDPHVAIIPNVSFWGRAFSKKYKPMDMEIEECEPDPIIYENFHRSVIESEKDEPLYRAMQNGVHIQFSYDGITQRKMPPLNTLNRYYIVHDQDLSLVDWSYLEASRKGLKVLIFSCPHEIYNVNELQNLKGYLLSSRSQKFILKFPMDKRNWVELNKYSNNILKHCIAEIGNQPLGGELLMNEIADTLNFFNYSKSKGKMCQLRYNGNYKYQAAAIIGHFLELWANSSSQNSFYDFCKAKRDYARKAIYSAMSRSERINQLAQVVPEDYRKSGGIYLL